MAPPFIVSSSLWTLSDAGCWLHAPEHRPPACFGRGHTEGIRTGRPEVQARRRRAVWREIGGYRRSVWTAIFDVAVPSFEGLEEPATIESTEWLVRARRTGRVPGRNDPAASARSQHVRPKRTKSAMRWGPPRLLPPAGAGLTGTAAARGERDLRPWPHPGGRDALRSAVPPSSWPPRSPPWPAPDGDGRRPSTAACHRCAALASTGRLVCGRHMIARTRSLSGAIDTVDHSVTRYALVALDGPSPERRRGRDARQR
jgi:hypothetical protein